VINGKGGTVVLIFSKEGVTQGDPLSMFGYGISILPLIRKLKTELPAVKEPWYTDDAGAGGSFTDLRKCFLRLQEIGFACGYSPEPSISILIVRAHNRTIGRSTFHDVKFKVQTSSCYLGGYIGSKSGQELWIQEKVTFWTSAVTDLAFTALSHPQTAFAGQQKSLQHKWQFKRRVKDNIGDSFFDVASTDIFLPTLYGESLKDCTHPCNLSALVVKFSGLTLPNPSASSEGNYKVSMLVCSHILAAFNGTESFSSADHQSAHKVVTAEIKVRLGLQYTPKIFMRKGNRAIAKCHALYTQRH
jgi:hypothetical protein